MRTWTAIKLLCLGLFLLAVGVAIKVANAHLAPEKVRLMLREELAGATEMDVSVGAARLGLDGVLRAEDVTIAPPGESGPLLVCPDVTIAFSRLSLLRLRPAVQRVVLAGPSIDLSHLPEKSALSGVPSQPEAEAQRRPPEGLLGGGVAIEDATVTLRDQRLFGDDSPRTYPGLYVTLKPDLAAGGTWQVEGKVVRGALAGTSVSGWWATGQEPSLTLNVDCGLLRVNRDVLRLVPYGHEVWRECQPEGNVAVTALLRTGASGPADFLVRVAVVEATVRTRYWPMRLTSVTGFVEVTPSQVTLQNLKAAIEPREFGTGAPEGMLAQVGMNGVARLGGRGGSYEIEATNVPLCRATVESIPDAGPELWQRLEPSGRARAHVSLRGPIGGKMQFTAVAEVQNATLHPKELPLPLEQVSGTIVADNAAVRLGGIGGVIPQVGSALPPALFSVDGLLNLKDKHSSLSVTVHGLRTDERVVKAIPSVGERVWELLRPEVLVDASVVLRDVLGAGQMTFSALLEVHSGRSRLAFPIEGLSDGQSGPSAANPLLLALDQVNGTVVVNEDGVRLRNVRGMLGQEAPGQEPAVQAAPFSADGLIDLKGEHSSLNVTVRNVRTNERIVRAVPRSGQKIWEMFRPEVVVDAFVQLTNLPGSGRLSYSVLLNLHGGRAEPQFCNIPLENTVGTIKVEEGRVSIENFAATVDTGDVTEEKARTISTIDVRGTLDVEAEKAEFYFAARDLLLTRNLVTAIPGVGEEVWKQTEPKGIASIAGKVVYDGAMKDGLRYILDVDLRDVSLLPEFIPVPVDALAGQLLVTERQAVCNSFTGVTCGGHIQGAAVAYYGPEGGTPSYGARIRFEQLELGELVKRLGTDKGDVSGRLAGIIDLGGVLGEPGITGGKGSLTLTEGRLWGTLFFVELLNVLHLSLPVGREPSVRGDMTFALTGDQLTVHEFDMQGGGLSLSGYGTVWLDGKWSLAMVAVGAPGKGRGIPVISPIAGWLLRAVERELVRLDVSGTIGRPVFEHKVLSTITWPLTSLRNVLFSPIFGTEPETGPEH